MSRFFSATYDALSSDEENLVSSDEEPLYTSDESSEEQLLEEEEEEAENAVKSSEDDNNDEYWGESTSSEEEEELSSSDDDDFGRHKVRGRKYFLKKSFLKGEASTGGSEEESSSEEEGEQKKVVKSAKEKYLDEIAELVDQTENYSMVQDWVNIASNFEQVFRLAAKHNQHHMKVPTQYVRCLAFLQDTLVDYQAHLKESKRKLNSSQSKSLTMVRQKVKRAARDCATELKAYREDPDAFLAGKTAPARAEASAAAAVAEKLTPAEKSQRDFFNAVKAILETRGKRNIDQRDQLQTLVRLFAQAKTSYEKISVLLLQISVRFDLYSKSNFMPADQWKLALTDVGKLLDILDSNETYVVCEAAPVPDDIAKLPKPTAEGKILVPGSIASFIERLADEISFHLLSLDPHSTEYVERLRDEASLYQMIVRAQLYYEPIKKASSELCRVVLRRLENVYYKPTKLIIFSEIRAWAAVDKDQDSKIYPRLVADDHQEADNQAYANGLIDSLCSVLYRQSNSAYRKKAVLYHIYNYALNDQYYKARNMMLLSHMQSSIHTADPQLQIHFNRALVQLGLAAFRMGLMHDCQQLLQEIVTSPRQKELLGQGVQRFQLQQSQVDKQRLLPFHMHINLELLECSFYTASLLIEVPLMAEYDDYAKRRQASPKAFRRVLEWRERQIFDGPPENARDHIMVAAIALKEGDWKKAAELLSQIEIWGLFGNADEIKATVVSCLQIQALRTFIFKNSAYYSRCSIPDLAKVFDLNESKVRAVLAKMIRNDDVHATINIKTNTFDFVNADAYRPNKLQQLVLNLSDKCGQMIERNEKLSIGGYQLKLDTKKLGQARTVQTRK